MDQAFNGLSLSALASVAGVTALVEIFSRFTGSVMNAGKASVQAYSSFEMLENGLSNMLTNMGEGADAGSKLFEELRKFSLETTFGVDTLASASQQLLTVGVSTDILKDKLKELGNISGGNTEKFNRLIEVYTKIKATGKATGIQINQLSMLTGVSFVQALGKANATAEELDEVFKQLTTDGGMFAGAMDSINDTIQGKMEFVSSTWTEFLASFGELSGLADTTKSALDTIYNVLQRVVDKMNEWNDNPVIQSILRGVLLASILSIGTVLGVTVVTALINVATQLGVVTAIATGLKAVINPLGLVLTGVIAGVTALGVAIKVGNDKQQKEIEKTTQKYRDQLEVLKDLSDTEIRRSEVELRQKNRNEFTKEDLINESAFNWYEEVVDYENKLTELKRDFYEFEAYKEGASLDDYLASDTTLEEQKQKVEELKARYETLNEQLKVYNAYKAEETRLNNQASESFKTFSSALQTANDWYADTTMGKIEVLSKQIEDYKQALYGGYDILVKLGNGDTMLQHISPTNDQITRGEQYINYLEEELSKLNSIANGKATKTWREFWKEVTGVNVQGLKGSDVSDKTEKELKKILERKIDFGSLIGTSSLDVYKEYVSQVESMITQLGEELNIDDIFNTDDSSIQGLVKYLNELKETRDKLQATQNEEDRKAKETEYIDDLKKEYYLYKSLLDSGKNRLQVEREIKLLNSGISEERLAEAEQAERLLELEKAKLSSMKEYYEYQKKLGMETGDVATYTEGAVGSNFMQAISGTDVGNWYATFEASGDAMIATVDTITNSFFSLLKNTESFNDIMNFVSNAFMQAEPLIEAITLVLDPIADVLSELAGGVLQVIGEALKLIATVLNPILKILGTPLKLIAKLLTSFAETISKVTETIANIIGRWFGWLDDFYDTEEEKRTDYTEIIDQLKKIKEAIKESEEYYFAQKQKLNANTQLQSMQVNDMILTDKGTFSTSPQDTIIAMKHPEDLVNSGSGVVNLNVNIENNAGVNVEVNKQVNGDGGIDLFVKLSEKIASDFASGANGWDSAQKVNSYRLKGRSVNI